MSLKEDWARFWKEFVQSTEPVAPPIETRESPQPDTGPPGLIPLRCMPFVPKRWGWESWIVNNDLYCGKMLFIKAGKWLSYHYHKVKDEVLFVQSGSMWMGHSSNKASYVDGDYTILQMGEHNAFHVVPNMVHQMEAIVDTYVIEFSTKHSDEDSYRVTTDNIRTRAKDLEAFP